MSSYSVGADSTFRKDSPIRNQMKLTWVLGVIVGSILTVGMKQKMELNPRDP